MYDIRRHWLLLGLLPMLVGCSSSTDSRLHDRNAPVAMLAPPKHWSVVLVAGDDSAPVFDNAVNRFRRLLDKPTVKSIRGFTSNLDKAADPDLATVDRIAAGMAAQPLQSDAGCLVFVTSHGDRNGAFLKLDRDHDQRLTPERLGEMLDVSCGQRPTVAIISACHSGIFLDDAEPNRIILTAARTDRASFGCGASFDYTYFDSCLLDQWPRSRTFAGLYDGVLTCVQSKEHELDLRPSEPQAAFGAAVGNLPLPD